MTVSVLLITHEQIGHALLDAVTSMFGHLPLPTTVVAITKDDDPDAIVPRLKEAASMLEQGQGLLVLTDVYGSTPSNIAAHLSQDNRIRVLSGLNLPMLICTMNYPNLDLEELAACALAGGREGVLQCPMQTQTVVAA